MTATRGSRGPTLPLPGSPLTLGRRSKERLGPGTDARDEPHGAVRPASRFVSVEDRDMYGRIKATVLGAAALALLSGGLSLQVRADDKDKHEAHHAHFVACAKACAECMRECESCAHHCAHLLAGGKKEHLKTLGTCEDCSEFCDAAAKVTSRHGPMSVLSCEACAKACDACGTECEKFPDDEHMKRCAKACRDCSKACREMIQMVGKEAAGK